MEAGCVVVCLLRMEDYMRLHQNALISLLFYEKAMDFTEHAVATVALPRDLCLAFIEARSAYSDAKRGLLPYRVACLVACVRALKAMTPASHHAAIDCCADKMNKASEIKKWQYSSSEKVLDVLDDKHTWLWRTVITVKGDCEVLSTEDKMETDVEIWKLIEDSEAFERFHLSSEWPIQ